jgi:hypothetical protein
MKHQHPFFYTAMALLMGVASSAQSPADNFGYKVTPYWGGVPVLTILWQVTDTEPFGADYKTKYTELVFGSNVNKPSLGGRFGFYDQISNGNFNFLNAGVLGPLTPRDVSGTPANESTLAGQEAGYLEHFRQACLMAEERGFNFRSYDKNGNGVISSDELCISIIGSDRRSHEFISTTEPFWTPQSGPAGTTLYNDLGYSFNKVLGYVYAPMVSPVPTGTKPLKFWFNSNTGDNYSSTQETAPAGYATDHSFGFVLQVSFVRPPNTVPVFTWRNNLRRDYLLTTTSGASSPEATALRAKGYNMVRMEGYIFDPALPQPPNTLPLYLWEGNGMIGGAQTPSINFSLASGLRMQTKALSVGQDCVNNLTSLGHEMIHYAGGIDVYGAGFGKNYQYSLMGALQNGVRVSHPDPMNKIMAGWIEPIAKTIGTRETFEILATENTKNSKGKAYVFYDPARGKKEFLILEYRYRYQTSENPELIPLHNLWATSLGDNWANTSYSGDALFDTRTITSRFHKTEGFIFKPTSPQPAGTVPLYTWYNNSIGDGFTTTNTIWTGRRGDLKSGYVCNGMIGYVYDPTRPQPENTLPLYLWYSPSRNDNFLTADKDWVGVPGSSTVKAPDYTCIRLEGYITQGSYFNYDGAPFTNLSGIPDNGLAIWYVKLGNNGIPMEITARDQNGNPLPGQSDKSVYLLSQSRVYGFAGNLFKNSDGVIDVNWPDGRASGLRVEVLTTNLTNPILKVRTR